MQAKLALLWSSLGGALMLLGGACALTWALAAHPGPARSLELALLPGHTLEIDIHPCASGQPGRLTVWLIDSTHANRFVREHFVLLLRTVVSSPCP